MPNKKLFNLKGVFNYKTETALVIFSIVIIVFSILTKKKENKPELKKNYTIIGGVFVGLSIIFDAFIIVKGGNLNLIFFNMVCIIVYAVLVGLSYHE